ncbi:unnamed protein product, partial [Urochloa humidicola]
AAAGVQLLHRRREDEPDQARRARQRLCSPVAATASSSPSSPQPPRWGPPSSHPMRRRPMLAHRVALGSGRGMAGSEASSLAGAERGPAPLAECHSSLLRKQLGEAAVVAAEDESAMESTRSARWRPRIQPPRCRRKPWSEFAAPL